VTAPIAGTVQLGGGSAAPVPASGTDTVRRAVPAPRPTSSSRPRPRSAAPARRRPAAAAARCKTTGPLTAGAPVTPGTTLATIVDVSRCRCRADVDETDVFLVKPGVKALAELGRGSRARSTWRRVASVGLSRPSPPAAGSATGPGSRSAKGTMPDGGTAPTTARPGMSAVADLQVRTSRDAVSVPAAAIVRDGSRDAGLGPGTASSPAAAGHGRHPGENCGRGDRGGAAGREQVVVRGATRSGRVRSLS